MKVLARGANLVALAGLCAILLFAFFDQIAFHDLPCPLCLLQRVALVAVGTGFALNLRFGAAPAHYGVALLSALVGAGISARQVLLHIVPGTGSYGLPFLGLHFYTWGLIAFLLTALAVGGLLLVDRCDDAGRAARLPPASTPTAVVIGLFLAIAVANALSTLLECGFGPCADNPTTYQMLGR